MTTKGERHGPPEGHRLDAARQATRRRQHASGRSGCRASCRAARSLRERSPAFHQRRPQGRHPGRWGPAGTIQRYLRGPDAGGGGAWGRREHPGSRAFDGRAALRTLVPPGRDRAQRGRPLGGRGPRRRLRAPRRPGPPSARGARHRGRRRPSRGRAPHPRGYRDRGRRRRRQQPRHTPSQGGSRPTPCPRRRHPPEVRRQAHRHRGRASGPPEPGLRGLAVPLRHRRHGRRQQRERRRVANGRGALGPGWRVVGQRTRTGVLRSPRGQGGMRHRMRYAIPSHGLPRASWPTRTFLAIQQRETG